MHQPTIQDEPCRFSKGAALASCSRKHELLRGLLGLRELNGSAEAIIAVNTRFCMQVSFNQAASDYTQDNVTFFFPEPWQVASLNPASGPLIGGTRVTVTGGPFLNAPSLRCRFGSDLSSRVYYVDMTTVVCIAPIITVLPKTAFYPGVDRMTNFEDLQRIVSVSMDSVHFSKEQVRYYYTDHLNAYVWGDNEAGQLGVPLKSVGMPTLMWTFMGRELVNIAFGAEHMVAIAAPSKSEAANSSNANNTAGQLYSWGMNSFGQLGTGDLLQRAYPTPIRRFRRLGERLDWQDIPVPPQFCKVSSQGYHTLAVTCDGDVFAWGRNENLQLGQPLDLTGSKEPLMITWFGNNGYKCTNVAAGLFFSLAVCDDANYKGQVFAWGSNDHGQLGVGDKLMRKVPVMVTGSRSRQAEQISAGLFHVLMRTADRVAYSWGWNNRGQLALGLPQMTGNGTTEVTVPQQIKLTSRACVGGFNGRCVLRVAAGAFHSILMVDRYVRYDWLKEMNLIPCDIWVAGRNDFGQLGVGTVGEEYQDQYVSPTLVPTTYPVVNVAAGWYHSLAVMAIPVPLGYKHRNTAQQRLVAWGSNDAMQLGLNHTFSQSRFNVLQASASMPVVFNDLIGGSVMSAATFSCPPKVDSPCSGHGYCTTEGRCYCLLGWRGVDCSFECDGGANNICSNHGDCGEFGECMCRTGWNGAACNIECAGGASTPCKGRGECSKVDGSCICKTGWTGRQSDGRIDCSILCPGGEASVCNLHGKCLTDGTCRCDEGFRFADCGTACPGLRQSWNKQFGFMETSNICSGHGTCDEKALCGCSFGYRGAACEIECQGGALSPCRGRGDCLSDGSCQCRPQYRGSDCGEMCPNEVILDKDFNRTIIICSNQGVCNDVGKCECRPGFRGPDCRLECPGGHANPCFGGGTCDSNAKCICHSGFRNVTCDIECKGGHLTPCSLHGECDTRGECICEAGFRRDDCSKECPGGSNSPCNSRGECTIDGMCICGNLFEGDACERILAWPIVLFFISILLAVGVYYACRYAYAIFHRKYKSKVRRARRKERMEQYQQSVPSRMQRHT